jgi:hypothetical protein
VRQTLGSGGPRAYAAAMAGLWLDVRRPLATLDAIAADPSRLQDGDMLPPLQYELHCAAEAVAGLTPPDGAQPLHEELAGALACARDATAEVWEAYEHGGTEAVEPLVWELRGILFRVRYARLRLAPGRASPSPRSVVAAPPARTPGSVTAGVVVTGSALVLAAALLGLWLVVALTLAVTVAASFRLRP